LSEGFATYFAALWTRAARGDSAFRVQMDGVRRTVLGDSSSVAKRPVIDSIETNYLALLNANSYQKGGFVLHMLRSQVGERAFFNAIRAYYAAYKHSTAVTDDLRVEMERASKQDLRWFFDQWLRKPGFPEVTATWAYDASSRETVVGVSVGSRFGAYRFPLTIAVVDESGAMRRATMQFVAAPGDIQQIRIPSASAPTTVLLDPDAELLAAYTVVKR
jgi:aminopeptidase N